MFDCSHEPVKKSVQSPLEPITSSPASRVPRLPRVTPTPPETPGLAVGVWMPITPAVRYPYRAGRAPVFALVCDSCGFYLVA
jgi:hypothetical protein